MQTDTAVLQWDSPVH